MIALLWLGMALANPQDVLPRADAPLTVRGFTRLAGDGPAWGYGPRRGGPVTAWIFPDGIVEHAELRKGKARVETRHFDAAGRPLTTTVYADDAPSRVVVHQPVEATFEVTSWEHRALGGATVRWPLAADGHRLAASVVETPADPRDPSFRDGLLAGCGCVLEGASAAWVEGHPGARYRVRVHDADGTWVGEVFAVSDGERALLISALVPATLDGGPRAGPAALTLGRALAALATFEATP